MDLELATVDDMRDELKRRGYDILIVITGDAKVVQNASTCQAIYSGNWVTALGLAEFAKSSILRMTAPAGFN